MTNISALFDVMVFTVIVNKKALNLVCTWLMFLMHDQNSIEEYLFEVISSVTWLDFKTNTLESTACLLQKYS